MDAAENVRTRIRKILLSKPILEVSELKWKIDNEAQEAIKEILIQTDQPVHVISEEGDYHIGERGPYLIVDPIDGTTNTARGIPFACTSIAVSKTPLISGIFAGIVENIYTGETFRAERNRGAWRGGQKIATSKSRELNKAIISIDVSKGASPDPVKQLIMKAGHIRQLGSAALTLCYLASGQIDAHVDLRGLIRVTDVAAALLIVKEAGGIYHINGERWGEIPIARDSTLNLIAASSTWTLEKVINQIN
jgi:myo-inositol-1(or 4)-monophosphatase